MANYLHLYQDNPTAGGVDGTEISSGSQSSPIDFLLDAGAAEFGATKCAARCDSGYYVNGETYVYFVGTTADMWSIAADNGYSSASDALENAEWSSVLTLAGVSAVNQIFWVMAASDTDELPQNDKTVTIAAEGFVVAED